MICVPGEFFDVNPGKRRSGRPRASGSYVRFSFGPEETSRGGRRAADPGDGAEHDGDGRTVAASRSTFRISSVSRGTISNRSPTIP